MPSTRLSAPYAAQALLLLSASLAGVQAQNVDTTMDYVGCFSSSQPLTDQGYYKYQTASYCKPICEDLNAAVFALSGGSDCWCGNQLPAASSKVSDSKCDVGCFGFGEQDCGGDGFWTVYTVDGGNVPNYSGGSGSSSGSGSDSSSSSPSSADASSADSTSPSPTPTTTGGGNNNNNNGNQQTTAAPSVITSIAPGQTIVKTVPAAEASNAANSPEASSNDAGGSNVAPIAAGVVVGVVAVAAIAGGLFWFMRRKKRQAAEDEYNRNNQVSDFMRGGERKPPQTGYSQMSDSRLDPEAGQRRDSQGSIADNQDYSRRILRVANPDGN